MFECKDTRSWPMLLVLQVGLLTLVTQERDVFHEPDTTVVSEMDLTFFSYILKFPNCAFVCEWAGW